MLCYRTATGLPLPFSGLYLILWHSGKGLDDGGQGHLTLFGEVGGAGDGVGGAAHKPGTGVTCGEQRRSVGLIVA